MCWAQEVEDALFARSHSKQVGSTSKGAAAQAARACVKGAGCLASMHGVSLGEGPCSAGKSLCSTAACW